jgi:hypothetical protein
LEQLRHIFGEFPAKKDNYYRLPPYLRNVKVPTIQQLFTDYALFDSFLLDDDDDDDRVTEEFNADRIDVPIQRDPLVNTEEFRFAPLICEPSETRNYFQSLKCFPAELDSEKPIQLNRDELRGMVKLLTGPYREHGFDKSVRDNFLHYVSNMATDLIVKHTLCLRWWYAACTYSFLQIAQRMQLHEMGRGSWTIEDWSEFWAEHSIPLSAKQLLHFVVQLW